MRRKRDVPVILSLGGVLVDDGFAEGLSPAVRKGVRTAASLFRKEEESRLALLKTPRGGKEGRAGGEGGGGFEEG